MIEEVEDVFDDLLNRLGIYGACGENCTKENPCRSHAEAYWRERIMAAIEVERKQKKFIIVDDMPKTVDAFCRRCGNAAPDEHCNGYCESCYRLEVLY
jgi:predicted secreted protein